MKTPNYMKYIALFLFTGLLFGQEKMGEQDAINKSHIDFTKQYIYFTISGKIEIDGHIFINDTCSNPIIFSATIDGIKINRKDSPTEEYERRKCENKDCGTLHLQKKALIINTPKYWWNGTITPGTIPL